MDECLHTMYQSQGMRMSEKFCLLITLNVDGSKSMVAAVRFTTVEKCFRWQLRVIKTSEVTCSFC